MSSFSSRRAVSRVAASGLVVAACSWMVACSDDGAPSNSVVPSSPGSVNQSGDLPPSVSSPTDDPTDGAGEGGDPSDG